MTYLKFHLNFLAANELMCHNIAATNSKPIAYAATND